MENREEKPAETFEALTSGNKRPSDLDNLTSEDS